MLTVADALELVEKYRTMLEMRVAHAAGIEDAGAVREQMSALATRFPGALREIDSLPLETIESRIGALEALIAGLGPAERWMEATMLLHRYARGALSAKRWLTRRRAVDPSVARDFDEALPSLAYPEDARAWRDELSCVASPPAGRLMARVFERVGEAIGATPDEARRLVFGDRLR